MGIGSLIVMNAMGDDHPRVPGNMFVPIDLLKPILAELRERGSSRSSHRAWIGVNCVEYNGQVRVMRVNEDSPAESAGLLPGDRIMRIDGAEVSGLEALWKTLWRGDTRRARGDARHPARRRIEDFQGAGGRSHEDLAARERHLRRSDASSAQRGPSATVG